MKRFKSVLIRMTERRKVKAGIPSDGFVNALSDDGNDGKAMWKFAGGLFEEVVLWRGFLLMMWSHQFVRSLYST